MQNLIFPERQISKFLKHNRSVNKQEHFTKNDGKRFKKAEETQVKCLIDSVRNYLGIINDNSYFRAKAEWIWMKRLLVDKNVIETVIDCENGNWGKANKKHVIYDTIYVAFSRSMKSVLALYDKYGGPTTDKVVLYFGHGKECTARYRMEFRRNEIGPDHLVFVSVYGATDGINLIPCKCTEELV